MEGFKEDLEADKQRMKEKKGELFKQRMKRMGTIKCKAYYN